MKKLSPYVKKRLAQIKREQRQARPKRKMRAKVVNIELKVRGFYLRMDLNPKDPIDLLILSEANKIILRRAC